MPRVSLVTMVGFADRAEEFPILAKTVEITGHMDGDILAQKAEIAVKNWAARRTQVLHFVGDDNECLRQVAVWRAYRVQRYYTY